MVVLGTLKQGDDKVFRTIVFGVGGQPQDLTQDGWTVASQLTIPGDEAKIDLTIDGELLASSYIVLSVDRSVSSAMRVGTWYGDVEVTGPAPYGRQSSQTFTVEVVEDVTKTDA